MTANWCGSSTSDFSGAEGVRWKEGLGEADWIWLVARPCSTPALSHESKRSVKCAGT